MAHDLPFEVQDRRKRGYFTIDNVLLDVYGKEIGPFAIAVYAVLARFANSDSECWPGYATIAERTGMSTKQVGREITKLAAKQIISVTPRYNPETKVHSSNLYTLLDITGGMDCVSIGGMDCVSIPMDRKSPRRKPNKKDIAKENDKRNYRPAEYDGIII